MCGMPYGQILQSRMSNCTSSPTIHKKACKKRAAELHDEALLKEPPPPEDCPICFLPLPLNQSESTFQSCCGKVICNGCICAMVEEAHGRGKIDLCAFCRVPAPKSEEEGINRIKKLMAADKAYAFYVLAGYYADGGGGMPQSWSKSNELLLKAGELGCARAYNNLGSSYYNGEGVGVDNKKATHYYELAAMAGHVIARCNLGCGMVNAGDYQRGMKHLILAAKAGDNYSLEKVKEGFKHDMVTKDEYADTLRAHQKIHNEMKSDMRDKARDRL